MEFTRKKSLVTAGVVTSAIAEIYNYYSERKHEYVIDSLYSEIDPQKMAINSTIVLIKILIFASILCIYYVYVYDEKIKVLNNYLEVYKRYFIKYKLIKSVTLNEIDCINRYVFDMTKSYDKDTKPNNSISSTERKSSDDNYKTTGFSIIDRNGRNVSSFSSQLFNPEGIDIIQYLKDEYGLNVIDDTEQHNKRFYIIVALVILTFITVFGVYLYYQMKI